MRIALAALAVGLVAGLGGGVTAKASTSEFPPSIFQVTWSPNGKWLAYGVNEGAEGFSVSVVRLDRTVQRRVVTVPWSAGISSAAWSPDSKELAVTGYDELRRYTTWISSANGTRLRRFDGRFGDWSPDSRRFLLERPQGPFADNALYVVNNATEEARFLLEGSGGDWSPDGTRIAFTAVTFRGGCFSSTTRRIFSVDTNGAGRRQLGADSHAITHQWSAGWAPDSSQLAYTEQDSYCNEPGAIRAFLVPADGSRQASELGHDADAVVWSPGGQRLAIEEFTWDMGTTLKILTRQGETIETIPHVRSPFAWGPGGGNVVYTARAPSGLEGIYTVRADGTGQPRWLGLGTQPAWSRLSWIALVFKGSCADLGERVYVERPDGKQFHVLSRCRPTR